jgi:hypothetical protein
MKDGAADTSRRSRAPLGTGASDPTPMSDDLLPRYAPGEDIEPLVRGLGAALLAGVAVLVVDRAVPSVTGVPWLWPALFADALVANPAATALGVAAVVVVSAVGALAFVYGQFRRFIPGNSVIAGVAWGVFGWLLCAGALLPRAAGWLTQDAATTPARAFLVAALAVAETFLTAVIYGGLVGWLNPRRAGVVDAWTRDP